VEWEEWAVVVGRVEDSSRGGGARLEGGWEKMVAISALSASSAMQGQRKEWAALPCILTKTAQVSTVSDGKAVLQKRDGTRSPISHTCFHEEGRRL